MNGGIAANRRAFAVSMRLQPDTAWIEPCRKVNRMIRFEWMFGEAIISFKNKLLSIIINSAEIHE